MQAGDILGVQGNDWFSRAIRRATGNGPLSHVGLVLSAEPPIVIEALTRVETRPLAVSIRGVAHAWVLEPSALSAAQRQAIIDRAMNDSARDYGFVDIGLQALDALCKTRWWTDTFAESHFPICSMLVGESYGAVGLSFGVGDKSLTPNDVWNYASAHPDRYRIAALK